MLVLVLPEFEAAPLANVHAARHQQECNEGGQHRQSEQVLLNPLNQGLPSIANATGMAQG